MTFLEKAMEKDKAIAPDIIDGCCPSDYGFEKVDETKTCTGDCYEECEKCWNREMPNTDKSILLSIGENYESSVVKKIKEHEEKMVKDIVNECLNNTEPHFSNPVIEKAYNTGLNDAWELAKEMIANFDGYEILSSYTPQEVIAKLKAYEEAQEQRKIKVGNVVENKIDTVKAVVMDNGSQEFLWQVFTENGCIELWKECEFKKTGKHIDIQSILEQIGE